MNERIRLDDLEDIVNTVTNQFCCGVADVDGASEARNESSTKRFVEYVLDSTYYNDGEYALPAHLIFTQASANRKRRGYGFRIAEYIRKHELGAVTESPASMNPRTGNYITVFVWTPNKAANTLAKKFTDYK